MTDDEREMLMEIPAVRELLAEEREACAALVDAWPRPSPEEIDCVIAEHQPCLAAERSTLERIAAAIRERRVCQQCHGARVICHTAGRDAPDDYRPCPACTSRAKGV